MSWFTAANLFLLVVAFIRMERATRAADRALARLRRQFAEAEGESAKAHHLLAELERRQDSRRP